MPIEYTISYDCPVKRALGGAEAFRTACTWRLLAKAAKKEAREQDLSFREVQVTHRFVTLDGLTEITEPLLNLMEEAEKLEAFAYHCEECPADVLSEGFGCLGTLGYPLSAEAEDWVHFCLEHRWPAWVLRAWLRFDEERDSDPARIALMRSRGEEFLEGSTAWGLTVRGELDDEEVALDLDADRVLAALFNTGSLSPADALMILGLFDVLDPEVDRDSEDRPTIEVAPDDGAEAAVFALDLYPESYDDPSTIDLKAFLAALFYAAGLGVDLVVEL
jgi:hypothetical protein